MTRKQKALAYVSPGDCVILIEPFAALTQLVSIFQFDIRPDTNVLVYRIPSGECAIVIGADIWPNTNVRGALILINDGVYSVLHSNITHMIDDSGNVISQVQGK
jgi:hypothetical protein